MLGSTTPRAVSNTPQATRWGNIWSYGYRTSLRSIHSQNLPCGRVNETSKDQITAVKDFSNQSRMAALNFRRYHDSPDEVKTTQRFFKSKQRGCFQFQKISRRPRQGKNNTKIFQIKIVRLLSSSEDIKTTQFHLEQRRHTQDNIGRSVGQRVWKRRRAYSPPPLVRTHA